MLHSHVPYENPLSRPKKKVCNAQDSDYVGESYEFDFEDILYIDDAVVFYDCKYHF